MTHHGPVTSRESVARADPLTRIYIQSAKGGGEKETREPAPQPLRGGGKRRRKHPLETKGPRMSPPPHAATTLLLLPFCVPSFLSPVPEEEHPEEQNMNSAELYDDNNTEVTKNILKVETNKEDEVLDCSVISKPVKNSLESLVNCLQDTNKRKRTSLVCNGSGNQQEILPSVKKRGLTQEGLISNLKHRDGSPTQEDVEQPNRTKNPNVTWTCEEEDLNNTVMPSYKKPLYGISHKITEKKTLPGTDQFTSYDLFEKVNPSSPSSLRNLNDQRKRDTSNLSILASESDPNIYSLIQKMFYTLNTLNSNMTQLHSKVDLLSLEVSRIKKHVNPIDIVADFRPPPEYQLTALELKHLMDQSTSGADLACRLLVQLFPELFSEDELSRTCSTCGYLNKKKLESLHLQLIRNYVEVCYPSVKNPAVWQAECLPQVNDFFNSFWAQRDMESSQPDIQASSFYETDQILGEKEDEEALSMERSNSIVSEWVFDAQDINEFLDEASSPGEFCVFLLHRLFPELFDHRKLAERYSCYGECGKQELDPQRLQVIRRYTEIYFPAMQERKAWLQHCVQRINDELESMYMDDSENEQMRDDCYDSSLPDDVSVIKVEDSFEYERPGRRSKKIWLVPIDFDKINVPSPDFDVPIPDYLLNKEQLKNIYESSLSIGNFASRLLVHLFPELFTHENLRKQYNCSGSLGKKQLDPIRIKLIRHYVQMLYPRAKNDRVWTLEFVGKLDERCRRRDTEQRRTYQLQRKVHVPGPERRDFLTYAINTERFKEEFEGPPLPPERSNKDFCKIPLEELVVPLPDFPVPSLYLLSDKEVREIVQQSLSVGNFAARLLVRLFPELFTSDNFRLQYNHSGACNKKQLDPVRLRLIRHYVEAVYPVDKMDEVWHYECIPSIDERCRRPNRKKCDILKKAKKTKK